jgi:hypothetical protein
VCKACTEKEDFVRLADDVIHLPELPLGAPGKQAGGDSGSSEGGGKVPNLQELMAKLKNIPGMDMKV